MPLLYQSYIHRAHLQTKAKIRRENSSRKSSSSQSYDLQWPQNMLSSVAVLAASLTGLTRRNQP